MNLISDMESFDGIDCAGNQPYLCHAGDQLLGYHRFLALDQRALQLPQGLLPQGVSLKQQRETILTLFYSIPADKLCAQR